MISIASSPCRRGSRESERCEAPDVREGRSRSAGNRRPPARPHRRGDRRQPPAHLSDPPVCVCRVPRHRSVPRNRRPFHDFFHSSRIHRIDDRRSGARSVGPEPAGGDPHRRLGPRSDRSRSADGPPHGGECVPGSVGGRQPDPRTGSGFDQLCHADDQVDDTVRVAPLVVVPGEHLHHVAAEHLGRVGRRRSRSAGCR